MPFFDIGPSGVSFNELDDHKCKKWLKRYFYILRENSVLPGNLKVKGLESDTHF
jgi:hypothetical protein